MSRGNALRAAARQICGREWEWEVHDVMGGDAVFHINRYLGPEGR